MLDGGGERVHVRSERLRRLELLDAALEARFAHDLERLRAVHFARELHHCTHTNPFTLAQYVTNARYVTVDH